MLSHPDSSPTTRIIDPRSSEWPHQALAALAEHPDDDVHPPARLWVRGEASLAELTARSITLEGAHAASPYGEYLAAEFGYDLARHGVTVVSGGGYGCAAAVVRGARAADGRVVVVLASGIAVDHPAGHAHLFRLIAANGGLIVSPHPPHTPPGRAGIARRALLLGALTRGTVIIEAGVRSGASHLARRARELGRAVMAVPGPVTSAASTGCHNLIRDGHATLVTTPAHALAHAGLHDPESAEANAAEDTGDAEDTTPQR